MAHEWHRKVKTLPVLKSWRFLTGILRDTSWNKVMGKQLHSILIRCALERVPFLEQLTEKMGTLKAFA